MLPYIWGKYAWAFIHLMVLEYPLNPNDDDKKHYRSFFNDLQYVLPCDKCKYNMKKHLKKYPLSDTVMANRNNLVRWTIELHNIVNYHTGKPMLSYDDALNKINKLAHPNSINYGYYFIMGAALSILIIFLIYYFNKKN